MSRRRPDPKMKRPRVSDELVYETILKMCDEAGATGSVRPQDVAMALTNENWQTLTKRIKLFASKLAQDDQIHILRKGEIADPEDFKGVYRLQIAPGFDRSRIEG